MKLIAALLLTAVHAKVKPLQLRKTSGVKAVQAVDLHGGKKASGRLRPVGQGQCGCKRQCINQVVASPPRLHHGLHAIAATPARCRGERPRSRRLTDLRTGQRHHHRRLQDGGGGLLMAQVSIASPIFDLKRNLLFFAFGGAYLGAFQYW